MGNYSHIGEIFKIENVFIALNRPTEAMTGPEGRPRGVGRRIGLPQARFSYLLGLLK